MSSPREERIARNEVAFRAFNEDLARGRGLDARADDEPEGFVCECGDLGCERFVRVPVGVYREVRAEDQRFLVIPGHDVAGVEDVVEQHEDYAVVRKHVEVAEIVDRD